MTTHLRGQRIRAQNLVVSPKRFLLAYVVTVVSIFVSLVTFASLNIFFQTAIAGFWFIVLAVIIFLLSGVFIISQWLFLGQLQQSAPLDHVVNHNTKGNTSSNNEITYRSMIATPPSNDPETIAQCEETVEKLFRRLAEPDTSAIVITGIAGVGKSTLASLIYRHAEKLRRTGKGPFTAEALWLRISDNTTLVDLAATIFTALGKPTPDLNKLAPQNQALELFRTMQTIENARLIVLDQFDVMFDSQTGYTRISSPAIGKWLDAINSQACNCRVLLTSRLSPRSIGVYPSVHMREYLCKGLEGDDGVELLQKQGLNAPDAMLHEVIESCSGHALALRLLASLLHTRNLSLNKFLEDPESAQFWAKDIAHNLLDNIYMKQLDQVQRLLLLAFSVYREPVPLNAAYSALADIILSASESQMHKSIDTLLMQHLLQALREGCYQPHAIITSYLKNHLEKSNELTRKIIQQAHLGAEVYYTQLAAKNCPPHEERRKISDVSPLVEAVWQRCQAGHFSEAYDLIEREFLFVDLKRWGGNATLLELYQLLLPLEKWHSESSQAIQIYKSLGRIYRTLGYREQAVRYLEKALDICREEEDSLEEGRVLAFLGRTYADLGQKEVAIQYHEKALKLRREVGNREGEGWTLDDLSLVYDDLGQFTEALKYGKQALEIRREIGDRRGEGRTLNTLGRVYDSLEQRDLALEFYQEALEILREVGDRGGEGAALNNLGLIYSKLGQREHAWEYYEKALHIFGEIGDRAGVGTTLYNLGLAYDDLGQKGEAKRFLERALEIRRDIGDRWGESMILNNLGKIYDELRLKEEARNHYNDALYIRREIKDRKGEGLTLVRLGGIYSFLGKKKAATHHLEQALNLFRELGERGEEGRALNDLGRINSVLGKKRKASRYLDEALSIFKEIGDHEGVGGTLNNLGLVYDDLGKNKEALQYLEQALNLFGELGDRWGEGRVLNSLGIVYSSIGQDERAQKLYEQSLLIRRDVGDRGGEATTLNNLGRIYSAMGRYKEALQYLQSALSIFSDLGDLWGKGRTLSSLGRVYAMLEEKEHAQQYFEQALSILREVGDRREKGRVFNSLAMLFAEQQPEMALKSLENALRISKEVKDLKGEGWALNNLGRVCAMLDQQERAQEYFKQALRVRREVKDLKGEGWTLHNIGSFYFDHRAYNKALACFLLAKALFDEVESPNLNQTQSYIDRLKQTIGEKEFADLLAEVEPQAHQIVKQILGDI